MDLHNEKSLMYKQSCKGVNNIRFVERIEEFIQFAKKNNSGSSVIIYDYTPSNSLLMSICFFDTIHLLLVICILLLIYKLKYSRVRYYLIRFNARIIYINFS